MLCVLVVQLFLSGSTRLRRQLYLPHRTKDDLFHHVKGAVDLVLFAFGYAQNGDILIQKAPACTIQIQVEVVCDLFGGKKEEIKVVSICHGGNMYDTLLTDEECAKVEDMVSFFRVPVDNRFLKYDKFFTEGNVKRCGFIAFNSYNIRLLNVEETKARLQSSSIFRTDSTVFPMLSK